MPSCRAVVEAILAARPIRALAAVALVCAAALAEAQSAADLTLSLTGTASAGSGARVTFSAKVTNVALYTRTCTFDPEIRRYFCEYDVSSADAAGVEVAVTLPPGFTATGASAPGFTCQLGPVVRCTGGYVFAGDGATVTVSAVTATVGTSTAFTTTARVDPANAIPERSESNNVASVSTTVAPPPPPTAELWVYESVTPATFPAWQSVTYSVSVHNGGPVPATGFTVQMYTNLPAGLVAWSFGGGFTCLASGGLTEVIQLRCTGSLGAYTSTTLAFQLKLANPFTPSGTPFTLYGWVDSDGVIPEGNEQDNAFTRAAIVQ